MTSTPSITAEERNNNRDQSNADPHAWLLLEGRITDLVSWSGVLRDLGASANQISGDGLILIGNALEALAGQMQAHYDASDVNVGRAG